MTTFPPLVPSSRSFTPGEYFSTAFSGYSGIQNRVRHSNVFLASQLRLSFLGLTQAQMLDVWNHYNGRRGEFRSFELPAEVVSYGSITDYVPGTYMWRYAGPGSVEDLPCGGHNVSLILETVPPSAASVVGAQLFTSLRLATGAANGGEYVPGSNEIIALSFSAGAAITALNGFNQSMILGLTPGVAQGDTSTDGAALSMIFWANYGQGASLSSLGVKKEIAFNLSAGGADNGINLDPDFADVSLLLHMDGSNGSTTFTDSSSNTLTVTASGEAEISTSVAKYGTGSASFNESSAGRLTTPNSSLFTFAGDFTIEFWAYRTSYRGSLDTIMEAGSSGSSFTIRASTSGPGVYFTGLFVNYADTLSLTLNTWHHIAVCREDSTIYVFKDGSNITTNAAALSVAVNNVQSNNVRIGESEISDRGFKGYIDDVRITKGVARYTANFTPPTAPFPDA